MEKIGSSKSKQKKTQTKNSGKKSKKHLYTKTIILCISGLFMGYFLVYCAFLLNGPIYHGDGLSKSDWLSFLGSFLGFASTTFLGVAAISQNFEFRKFEKNERKELRSHEIQPIIIIEMKEVNTSLPGIAEAFNLYDLDTLPKHNNFVLNVKNIGSYCIIHVSIFDSYFTEYLMPNQEKSVYCAFNDSPDIKKYGSKLISVDTEFYEKTDSGYPKELTIGYYDVDGYSYFQNFSQFKMEERLFYVGAQIEPA